MLLVYGKCARVRINMQPDLKCGPLGSLHLFETMERTGLEHGHSQEFTKVIAEEQCRLADHVRR